MPVKRAPKDKKIEEFINKNEKPSHIDKPKKIEWERITLRLPKNLLNAIDEIRSDDVILTRNSWILNLINKAVKDYKNENL